MWVLAIYPLVSAACCEIGKGPKGRFPGFSLVVLVKSVDINEVSDITHSFSLYYHYPCSCSREFFSG